jgi:hypothetical protein
MVSLARGTAAKAHARCCLWMGTRVMRRKRLWVFLACAIAIGAMILLSAGISELEFQPGQPLPRFRVGEDAMRPLPRFLDSSLARYVVGLIYALAFLLLPVSIVYLIISPKARRRAMKTLALILCLVVLLLLYPHPPAPEEQAQLQPPPDISMDGVAAPVVEFVANPPQWAVLGTAIGLALLLAAGLVGVFWIMWQRGRRAGSPLEQLAEQAEGAIGALQAGADLQDTVMRCYFEMSRVLREQRGIRRDVAMTPREFEQYLSEEGLPEKQVGRLTRLFERVRYGAQAVGKREELEAIDCLTAILEACRSLR